MKDNIFTLKDACVFVMNEDGMDKRYPDGINPSDILREIRERYPDEFPLATVIDVADAMKDLYWRPE